MVLLCALPSQASNTGGAAGVGGTTATVSLLVKETEQGGRQPPQTSIKSCFNSPACEMLPIKPISIQLGFKGGTVVSHYK